MSYPQLSTVETLVIRIAARHFDKPRPVHRSIKEDGSFVTETDRQIQADFQTELSEQWPDIRLLGEEMTHSEQRALMHHHKAGLWVLDPLDGTTNFTYGLPLFGVSLAFVVEGETLLAVVYDPTRKELFSAEKGKGAFFNGERIQPCLETDLSHALANVDYKRLTGNIVDSLISCPPYKSERNIGTCVLEWCWLAVGRFQVYLHGGQQLWDRAAGLLILQEAGGVAETFEGESIQLNSLTKQSSIAASNRELFEQWSKWVHRH